MADDTSPDLKTLVAEVAAAYFANSHVATSEIGSVIEQIARSLGAVGEGSRPTGPAEEETSVRKITPAQIRKSVTPDALISFEDGRSYKTLRRHLAVKGLTPEQYREKWGLPADYPIVAPSYSAQRSQLAKQLGLGNRSGAQAMPRRRGGRGAAKAT